jgi:flavin-dependent dehydrogenase
MPDRKNTVANSLGLAAGDAAGFCDPLTGEGIHCALETARLASRSVVEALGSGKDLSKLYAEKIDRAFRRDLALAGCMANVLYRLPPVTGALLTRFGNEMAETELKVIRARQSYEDIARRFFNPALLAKSFMKRASDRQTPDSDAP